ncbi:MAG: UvrD-helicase domain-containing protein [Woeseia sp.]
MRLKLDRYLRSSHSLYWRRARRELKRFHEYFDSVESNPLTRAQRLAVLLDEPRNLVVAGAGTGKTSVLVAKVGYLLKSGLCQPDEILMLAFNAKAAAELTDRVAGKFGADITARTFHGLGNEILGQVNGEKPPLTPLASDRIGFNRWVSKLVNDLLDNRRTRKQLLSFFVEHLQPSRPLESFSTEREYRAYMEALGLRTLQGERVKSLGELEIANFLYAKGVDYAYEHQYEGEVPVSPDRRVYLPDFFLPGQGIYIEHFGLSRAGTPPPFVDKDRYLRDMEWKRDLHRTNATPLVETFSYQRSNDTLLRDLDRELREASVPYEPRSPEQIRAAAEDAEYHTMFGSLVSTFLTHYRSNNWTIKTLRKLARRSNDKARNLAFLKVFEHIVAAYDQHLKDAGEIDFSDMINRAEAAASAREWLSPWKYILVDEFQDLSVGRYGLIETLLKQRTDAKLFAVGDDWQAIYRFAGSDISLMTGFRKHLGKCTVTKLDQTFRFNSSIESVSSQFVLKNPKQIRKRLKAARPSDRPCVTLHWNLGAGLEELIAVVSRMATGRDHEDGSLLILARYKHDLPGGALLKEVESAWSPGTVHGAMTIHAAKGMQADYVLITDLFSGKYGFPSEMADDPILDLVLSEPESHPNAEERRLLYVALTRARHEAHIVTSEAEPSSFAEELRRENYAVAISAPFSDLRCPKCIIGLIRRRSTGRHGCNKINECGFTAPACPVCNGGFLLAKFTAHGDCYVCSEAGCSGTAPVCPDCGSGAVVARTGKYGEFFGCSEYPACEFTTNDLATILDE